MNVIIQLSLPLTFCVNSNADSKSLSFIILQLRSSLWVNINLWIPLLFAAFLGCFCCKIVGEFQYHISNTVNIILTNKYYIYHNYNIYRWKFSQLTIVNIILSRKYYINQNYYKSHIKLNKFNRKCPLGEIQTRYSINNILTGIYHNPKQQIQ